MHILSPTYSSDNFFVFRLQYFVYASFLAVSLSPVDCGISGHSSFCQVLQPVRLKTIVWLPQHFCAIRKSRVYGLSSVCVIATVTLSTPSTSTSTPTASAINIRPGTNLGASRPLGLYLGSFLWLGVYNHHGPKC